MAFNSYQAWAEAFAIFYHYDPREFGHVAAQDDIIYAGPDPRLVSPDDKKKLKKLGWLPAREFECFYCLT